MKLSSFDEIGSVTAERAGEGEVGGYTQRVQTAWLSVSGLRFENASVGSESRGSHIDVACRSVCDRDQNEIKRSTFILGADPGIKMKSV